jgi:hypothetical protein
MNSRILLVSFIALGFTACGKAKFSASKNDALSKTSVFGNDATGQIKQPGTRGGDAGGNVNQPSGGGGAGGNFSQPGGSGGASGILNQLLNQLGDANGKLPDLTKLPGVTELAVELVCSDSQSMMSTNLKKAIADNLPVELVVNDKTCTTDMAKVKAVALAQKFTVADVQALCPDALIDGKIKSAYVDINGSSNIEKMMSLSGKLQILYARNTDKSVAAEAADSNCDRRSSPLVIHRTSDVNNPVPIALSSAEDGVDFDLLGDANGHAPVRISWFTNYDYQVLTLPNSRGEVNGIDELFGNNTRGPDGEYAENGYAALAKYDGTTADGMFRLAPADGRIDAHDAVYSKLRLWTDRNFDGVASRRELTSLKVAGVVYIDLDFSDDFYERDEHGNETKMKSVVGNADGSMDLIFDLWFHY